MYILQEIKAAKVFAVDLLQWLTVKISSKTAPINWMGIMVLCSILKICEVGGMLRNQETRF